MDDNLTIYQEILAHIKPYSNIGSISIGIVIPIYIYIFLSHVNRYDFIYLYIIQFILTIKYNITIYHMNREKSLSIVVNMPHKPRIIIYKCVVTCCCLLLLLFSLLLSYDHTGAVCNYLFLDYMGLIHVPHKSLK